LRERVAAAALARNPPRASPERVRVATQAELLQRLTAQLDAQQQQAAQQRAILHQLIAMVLKRAVEGDNVDALDVDSGKRPRVEEE